MSDEGNASSACGRLNWCRRSGGGPPSSAKRPGYSTAPRHVSVPSDFARSAVGVISDRVASEGLRTPVSENPTVPGSLSSTAMSARNSRGQSPEDLGQFRKTGGQTPDDAAVGQRQCLMLLSLPRGERTRVGVGDDYGHQALGLRTAAGRSPPLPRRALHGPKLRPGLLL